MQSPFAAFKNLSSSNSNENNLNLTFENISKPQLLFADTKARTSQNQPYSYSISSEQRQQMIKEQIQHAFNSIIPFDAANFKSTIDYISTHFKICDFHNSESEAIYINKVSQFNLMLQNLSQAPVIAWDIHVNTYRSFQGFICFLEISMRGCDYIVDCLSLRGEIHRLNEIFASDSIVKVTLDVSSKLSWMHREFGIASIVNSLNISVFLKEMNLPTMISYLSGKLIAFDFTQIHSTFDFRKRPVSLAEIRYLRAFSYLPLRILAALAHEIQRLPNLHRLFEGSQLSSCLQITQALSHDLLATHLRMFAPIIAEAASVQSQQQQHLANAMIVGCGSSGNYHANRIQYVVKKILKWRIHRAELEDENVEFIFPAALIAKFIRNFPKNEREIFVELKKSQAEVSLDYALTVFSFFDENDYFRHLEKQRRKEITQLTLNQSGGSLLSTPQSLSNQQQQSLFSTSSPPMSPNTLLKSIGWVADQSQQEGTPEKHYKALISSHTLSPSILTYSPQNGVDSPKHDGVMKEVLNVLNERCSKQSVNRFYAAVARDSEMQKKEQMNDGIFEEEEVRFHAKLMNKLHGAHAAAIQSLNSKKENTQLPQNIADIFELANRKRKVNKDKKRKRDEKSPTPHQQKETPKEKEKLNIDKLLKEINWI